MDGDLLEAKGVTKFGQLINEDAEEAKHRYRLRVIASDVTHRRMLVLPNDADHLGIDPDELDVAYAVRMSMSIPIFFEPVKHRNPKTGEEHLLVDGGMLSNFPVWLFDREGKDPRWPTFGLLLVEPDPKKAIGHRLSSEDDGVSRGSLLEYLKAMALTMMAAHERIYLEKATYARTIPIPTLGVGQPSSTSPLSELVPSTTPAMRPRLSFSAAGTSMPTLRSSAAGKSTLDGGTSKRL